LLLLIGCGTGSVPTREGTLAVPNANLWYRVVGEGKEIPLLVIHGGPGGRSCDLANLEALATDRPVIFYDQRGSGRSSVATDTASWNLPRFVADLDSLRRALGLTEVHLYGHSWGAALAVEYLLTHGSEGIRSVTLASPLVSAPRWAAIADSLLGTLPAGSREAARRLEAQGATDAAEYRLVVRRFDERWGRRGPEPFEVTSACEYGGDRNSQLYQHMWGPSEFAATGALRAFDRFEALRALRVPTLVMVGEHDIVVPAEAERIAAQIAGAELAVIPGAAHVAMQDAPGPYVERLRRFLTGAAGRRK
jgi:proline iminopeptidase